LEGWKVLRFCQEVEPDKLATRSYAHVSSSTIHSTDMMKHRSY